jgi:hypothetical protein
MTAPRAPNPIRWVRDVGAAAWWARAARSSGRVSGLVPAGYEAYARVTHPRRRVLDGWLPIEERRILVDILRAEGATPDRCWFCVEDGRRELDDQGVAERVELRGSSARYLLHGGPIERVLLPPPHKPLPAIREGAMLAELAEELSQKLEGYTDLMIGVSRDATLAEAMAFLAGLLDDMSPTFWWPEDRAWFVATTREYNFGATYVGGSRRLIDRLIARPDLEVLEAHLEDDLAESAKEEQQRGVGPVIARGTEAGFAWTLRGRIDADGVWTALDGWGIVAGPLPFQDMGVSTMGHFGAVGSSPARGLGPAQLRSLEGVVSKQTVAVEVHLTDGTIIPAQIVDTGDERASFFVAVWSAAPEWKMAIARDASGRDLQTQPAPDPRHLRIGPFLPG